MRKTFMLGAVMAVAVAGAVFAARPDDPPKPPVIAHKAEPQPKAKEEPKPGDKAAFTTTPKLQRALDLIGGTSITVWNSTGTHLAIRGLQLVDPVEAKKTRAVVWLLALDATSSRLVSFINDRAGLVAVAPDGTGIVTDLREYNLISGRHHLNYWSVRRPTPGGGSQGGLVAERVVELDLPETHGYAFAADGKTYRTVAYDSSAPGEMTKLEVLEVDATTGKVGKVLLKLDFGTYALSANGKRLAVLNKDTTKVTVHDVDTGAKASEYAFAADTPVELPGGKTAELPRGNAQAFLLLSPDGRRLVVSRGIGRTHVINADTGAALPNLEGAALARTYPDTPAFTRDGRLLAATGRNYSVIFEVAKGGVKEQPYWSSTGTFLTVWDTQTGKALKTWKTPNSVASVTFSPTKPLLAILEPNGADSTRVGFWDFADK